MRFVPHPMQPIVLDEHGVARFCENKIVSWLLARSDMNEIARQFRDDVHREDREQLAQLIGYSVSGAHDLSYMGELVLAEASRHAEALLRGETVPKQGAEDLRGRLAAALEECAGLRRRIADAQIVLSGGELAGTGGDPK